MRYYIDYLRIVDNSIKVIGWVLPKDPYSITDFLVTDSSSNTIDYKLARVERMDIAQIFIKNNDIKDVNFGFEISFPIVENEKYNLYIKTKEKTIKETISKDIVNQFNEKGDNRTNIAFRRKQYIINLLQIDSIKRGFNILKKHGIRAYLRKLVLKIQGMNATYDYNEWYKKTKVTVQELKRQKDEYKIEFEILPKFSIVIPLYNTNRDLLIRLMNSIENQSYDNYEVVVCDATDYTKTNNNPKEYFDSIKNNNKVFANKINYIQIDNKSISENTNEAKSNSHFEPHFKSDFNIDMLTSVNYICHIACIKKELVKEVIDKYGAFERKEYNGAQDYDLFLRIANILLEQNKQNTIRHIPKVLYHWRSYEGSTSYKTSQKNYAIVSGTNCLIDYYSHSILTYPKVKIIEQGVKEGFYRTIFEERDYGLLSILIPNKDHTKDLDKLFKSLEKSSYKNFEVVIVENNSTEKETFEYYDNINDQYSFDIKVVYYKDKFNYSKINNYGLKYCSGEYILFMNNDIEMINEDSLKEMMDYIVRDDVGAVGAKLLYDDKTIQHAGVIIGIGGIASHAFKNVFDLQSSYMNRAQIVQDLNAVTAAVLLTKKSILNQIKGFDEDFSVAFNDIDLCLRIRRLDKLIVYNPYACFYHYESKTRGYEDTKEKVDRFNTEVARFVKRWQSFIDRGDQYYNQNLTLMKEDFSLRDLDQEEIGKPYVMDKEIYRIMETL